jgi:hypothetical protein
MFWSQKGKISATWQHGEAGSKWRIGASATPVTNGERFSADFESLCFQQSGLTDNEGCVNSGRSSGGIADARVAKIATDERISLLASPDSRNAGNVGAPS